MGSQTLLVMLLGAVIGAGVLLVVFGMSDHEPAPLRSSHSLGDRVKGSARRALLGVGAGLLILVLTSWPVLAVAVGLLVWFSPMLFGGLASEKRAMSRLEGLAAWTESLRDTIAGAVGLEQAIPATAYAASPAIQPALIRLTDRLRVRTNLSTALQGFADDIDDPSADLIVATLILNARLRGPGLREVLTSLAKSARSDLDMRRRIAASRSSTRRSVQIVIGVTVAFVLGLAIFNRSYVEPYSTPIGQLVLLVVIGLFGAGFIWMRRLSEFEMPERFLLAKQESR
ncbi:type II secretion system F family protein [Aeromicrobium senzhongii]|uniref:Type II secretion system F family protein n=1 Tax=Aeromicrobium senzhongii TaxID=2663859 RepID=A0ABX6SQZ1_9ACTN|nr:type II secretion system F family protein [Aeromicrobium senzhongii]MTB89261.1 type II secretion system protein [Aeromicrobium senzhongii]QNL93476.1 type II secretion system F family protein [Aeromicrobium senzhongii]